MKKLNLLLFVFFIAVLSGCSSDEKVLEKFDDRQIDIKLTHQYENDYFVGYVINLTNNSEVTISFLNLYVSLPVVTKEGEQQNDFVIVGVPQNMDKVHLKNGESMEFTFDALLESINLENVNKENPEVKITGYIDEDIPFGISGNISAFE